MRTVKGKMKLNQFSKNELEQRKLNALKGGCICSYICQSASNDCLYSHVSEGIGNLTYELAYSQFDSYY